MGFVHDKDLMRNVSGDDVRKIITPCITSKIQEYAPVREYIRAHASLTWRPQMYFGSSKKREAAKAAFQRERLAMQLPALDIATACASRFIMLCYLCLPSTGQ